MRTGLMALALAAVLAPPQAHAADACAYRGELDVMQDAFPVSLHPDKRERVLAQHRNGGPRRGRDRRSVAAYGASER